MKTKLLHHLKNAFRSYFSRISYVVLLVSSISISMNAQTNIATSGTGSIWQDIPAATSTSNASKSNNVGINNGNLTTDIALADVTNTNNWQAVGITWTTAQNGISSIRFYNGFTSNIAQDNGVFAANAKIQSSTDGSTWSDVSGWSFSPAYAYSVASSNVIYTISGTTLNNIKGIRVVGQLRIAANEFQTSWAIKVKEVQVFSASNVAVSSVSVSPTSTSLNIGNTASLTATVLPANATNKAVTWSSSNSSIATVNASGVVTAVASGSATITVTTQDGSKTATCAVIVAAPSGNIATSGTGLIWQDIPAANSTSDASKSTNAGINNGNVNTDVVFLDVNAVNNWQAAGVTWSTAQNGITSVKYYNGSTNDIIVENGVFSANVKIQSSTDGTTWTDVSGWSFSPAYAYSVASSNVVYEISGSALNNIKGIRVIGQLRLAATEYQNSWSIKVKEIEVFAGPVTNVPVTGVSVNPTSASVNVGSTTALTATVSPANATNKNVTWSSSNAAIATVNSSGVVTGVAAGSANITVTTQDGNKTAVATITVNNVPVVNVTSVSVSPSSSSITTGSSVSLTATILPSNATNKNVSWSSSNSSVAAVNSTGVVTGVAAGSATITVTTQDGGKTATSSITVSTAPTSSRVNVLGINVGNPGSYFSEDITFTDAMKSSMHWKNASGNLAATDANYWPTEDASVLVFSKPGNSSGTYKLSFDGRATVSTNIGTLQNVTYNSTTNKSTADLVISNVNMSGTLLSLDFSGTTGGVKNVKLMRPITPGSTISYASNVIFTDFFKNAIAPYKVLRSLGWISVNWSPDSLWSDRTLWSHSHQSPNEVLGRTYNWEGRGASWESLILLANEVNKDVWITVPAKATNDYITKLAQLFKYGSDGTNPYTSTQANPVLPPLNSNLKIYVEYSNEIWNGQFSQTGYSYDKSRLEPANSPIRFDNETDETTLSLRFKAMRSVQISDMFRTVFGNADMITKVRPVMAWQLAYSDLTNRTLSFIDRYYGKKDSRSNYATPHPVNYYFYGGGASFYWYSDETKTLTTNSIWNSGGWNATAEFNDPWGNPYYGFVGKATTDAAWAKHYGLSYICYEGDNHPTYQNNDESIMAQTHWDARMKQNTLDHLNVLNQVDCEFGNFLVPGGSGSNNYWSILNYQNEGGLGSPQWDAINQWLAATPLPINVGSMAPFSRPGNSYNCPDRNDTKTGSTVLSANTSPYYTSSYMFRVPSNGTYNIRVDYSTTSAAKLEVEFNGNNIGTYNLTNTNGVSTLTLPANFTANSNKLYSIRLVCTSGSVTVNNVNVASGAGAKTSFESTESISSVSIYPNPAQNSVTVNTGSVEGGLILISDMEGKVLMNTSSSSQEKTISLENLSSGIYIVTVKTSNGTVFKKLFLE